MSNPTAAETQFIDSALREELSVRPALISEIYSLLYTGRNKIYTGSTVTGMLETVRLYKQRHALKFSSEKNYAEIVEDKHWVKFLDRLYVDHAHHYPQMEALIAKLNDDRLAGNLPDVMSLAVYENMKKALDGMPKAIASELKFTAEHRGISIDEAETKFYTLRDSYETFSAETKNAYVDQISAWVGSGFNRMKGFKFFYVPADDAVLYALYRLRTDVNLFAVDTRNIVSVDIETAGPAGREGFVPSNGRIIEVGIVEYTHEGVELSRKEWLIRPEDTFLAKYGTGAIEIHNISVADLDGKPAFAEVAAEILESLRGRKLLAQNANFERSWFHTHLDGFTALNMPTVDTLEFAEKFLPDTENNKLETICSAVGVAYTNGHRALHDALVTGVAYFAILKKISSIWN